ncbi:MAG: AI-2E family transporter [Gemmatimonadales bacterium]|nr:MAG: AI-2E family transporter [Gemmatimonadales bacterium]
MPTTLPSLHRNVLLGAGLVIIAAGMHAAASTINLVLISLLLAISASPLTSMLQRRGLKHGSAVLLTVVGTLVGGVIVLGALAGALRGMEEKLPTYQAALTQLLSGVEAKLAARGMNMHEMITPDPERLVAIVQVVVGTALQALGYGLFALILVALILVELPNRPDDYQPTGTARDRFDAVGASVRQFVGLTGMIGAGQAVVNLAIMLAVGTDFPVVWGVLFFLLSFVPFGFAIGMIPPLIVTLLEHGVSRAVILVVVLMVANVISDNVIKPRMMGKGLGLSPLVIVLSLMLWSFILGPVGALLAVPLTIAITMVVPGLSGGTTAAE